MTPRLLPDGRKLCAKCGDELGGEHCRNLRGTCWQCGVALHDNEPKPTPAPLWKPLMLPCDGWGVERPWEI